MAHQRCRLVCILASLTLAMLLAAPLVWQGATLHAAALPLNVEEGFLNLCEPDICPPNTVSIRSMAVFAPLIMGQSRPQRTVPAEPLAVPPPTPRGLVIDRQRLFYEPDFYAPQIQAFLETQPGPLKSYVMNVGDDQQSFAEVLGSQAALYSLNPKVVLALIEQQSGLITHKAPTEAQQKFMLGFQGDDKGWAGWVAQLHWVIRELHYAQHDFPHATELTYADNSRKPLPAGLNVGDYAIMRVLAATISPASPKRLDHDVRSFITTYTRLFGDPRVAPQDWPVPAAPFLSLPMKAPRGTTSFFDHDSPFLRQNGSIVTYRGDRDPILSYDGHDGWDYALEPEEPILAAAAGTVVFAGNSDDGCGVAKAVIIDHHNGYRTLYWHLSTITIEPGPVNAGDQIGINGGTGCASGEHLHFQVQYLGRDTDPAGWCGPADSDPWARHPAGQLSTWLWRDRPSPCQLPVDAIVVGINDSGFKRHGKGWEEVMGGLNGTALRVPDTPSAGGPAPRGTWQPPLSLAGKYRVLAWVPYVLNGDYTAEQVHYRVGHADAKDDTQQFELSQRQLANGWADLGVHFFDPQHKPFVSLAANTNYLGTHVVYDTIVWLPVELQPPDVVYNVEDSLLSSCKPNPCPGPY